MSEQDLVKGLIDSGLVALLMAYVIRLDNQRNADAAAYRLAIEEVNERRAEDANRWLSVYTGTQQQQQRIYQSREPTKLE